MYIPFTKMHGAGNDFVVIDCRYDTSIVMTNALARTLAGRRRGIGCDQVVVMDAPHSGTGPHAGEGADVFIRIFNADGGMVAACGNATRCVGWRIMQEKTADTARVESAAGVFECWRAGEARVRVAHGTPEFNWIRIPLTEACDPLGLDIAAGPLENPVALSMGNPHAVFFVEDTEEIDLAKWGPVIEHHPLFPERTNVEIVQVVSREELKIRVWERGVGETLACGTGACASMVAAVKRGFAAFQANLHLPGGAFQAEWNGVGDVLLTGPVATVFEGHIEL